MRDIVLPIALSLSLSLLDKMIIINAFNAYLRYPLSEGNREICFGHVNPGGKISGTQSAHRDSLQITVRVTRLTISSPHRRTSVPDVLKKNSGSSAGFSRLNDDNH